MWSHRIWKWKTISLQATCLRGLSYLWKQIPNRGDPQSPHGTDHNRASCLLKSKRRKSSEAQRETRKRESKPKSIPRSPRQLMWDVMRKLCFTWVCFHVNHVHPTLLFLMTATASIRICICSNKLHFKKNKKTLSLTLKGMTRICCCPFHLVRDADHNWKEWPPWVRAARRAYKRDCRLTLADRAELITLMNVCVWRGRGGRQWAMLWEERTGGGRTDRPLWRVRDVRYERPG